MNAWPAERDSETRQRLLDAAIKLFVERGFENVTVRDICKEAAANIASVNYHFGDKMRLYQAVVQYAIDQVRGRHDEIMRTEDGIGPDEKLRRFIRMFLERVVQKEREKNGWVQKLFQHELANPTDAANLIVDQVIRPRIGYLSGIVGDLLGDAATREAIERCVISIQAQCLFHAPSRVRTMCFGETAENAEELERLAEHIFAFSMAGIQMLARREVRRDHRERIRQERESRRRRTRR